MIDPGILVLAILLGLLAEALRIVRPGQVLLAPDLLGRYAPRNAPRLLAGESFAVHLVPFFSSGPTLRLHELAPATASSRGCPGPGPSPAERLDPRRAREGIERLLLTTRPTAAAGRLLAFHLLVLTPALLLVGIVPHGWIVLAASLAGIEAILLAAFARAHRALHPGRSGHLVQHALTMLFFPPAGVFATDALAADALPDVHPLAAALALCPEEEARRLAGVYLREWRHPLPGGGAERPESWIEAACRALERRGWCPDELLAAPDPDGPASVAYCPRCRAQYRTADGDCPDCPGIGKAPFARVAAPRARPRATPCRRGA